MSATCPVGIAWCCMILSPERSRALRARDTLCSRGLSCCCVAAKWSVKELPGLPLHVASLSSFIPNPRKDHIPPSCSSPLFFLFFPFPSFDGYRPVTIDDLTKRRDRDLKDRELVGELGMITKTRWGIRERRWCFCSSPITYLFRHSSWYNNTITHPIRGPQRIPTKYVLGPCQILLGFISFT